MLHVVPSSECSTIGHQRAQPVTLTTGSGFNMWTLVVSQYIWYMLLSINTLHTFLLLHTDRKLCHMADKSPTFCGTKQTEYVRASIPLGWNITQSSYRQYLLPCTTGMQGQCFDQGQRSTLSLQWGLHNEKIIFGHAVFLIIGVNLA